jgi:hypothetical protein
VVILGSPNTVGHSPNARLVVISYATLVASVGQANRGLIDADLDGRLIKQRVAREGGGNSGGDRTVLRRSGYFCILLCQQQQGSAGLPICRIRTGKKISAGTAIVASFGIRQPVEPH